VRRSGRLSRVLRIGILNLLPWLFSAPLILPPHALFVKRACIPWGDLRQCILYPRTTKQGEDRMASTEDTARLPKWAQRRLQKLENDVAFYTAELAEGPENSDTFADPHSDTARRPLGTGTLIRFAITKRDDGSVRDYIDARLDGDTLEIRASRRLTITPQSSNVVHARNEAS
jgi:hypothetical protein